MDVDKTKSRKRQVTINVRKRQKRRKSNKENSKPIRTYTNSRYRKDKDQETTARYNDNGPEIMNYEEQTDTALDDSSDRKYLKALQIHGYSDNHSIASSSSSGLSEYDELYFKYKPVPLDITSKEIVVISSINDNNYIEHGTPASKKNINLKHKLETGKNLVANQNFRTVESNQNGVSQFLINKFESQITYQPAEVTTKSDFDTSENRTNNSRSGKFNESNGYLTKNKTIEISPKVITPSTKNVYTDSQSTNSILKSSSKRNPSNIFKPEANLLNFNRNPVVIQPKLLESSVGVNISDSRLLLEQQIKNNFNEFSLNSKPRSLDSTSNEIFTISSPHSQNLEYIKEKNKQLKNKGESTEKKLIVNLKPDIIRNKNKISRDIEATSQVHPKNSFIKQTDNSKELKIENNRRYPNTNTENQLKETQHSFDQIETSSSISTGAVAPSCIVTQPKILENQRSNLENTLQESSRLGNQTDLHSTLESQSESKKCCMMQCFYDIIYIVRK